MRRSPLTDAYAIAGAAPLRSPARPPVILVCGRGAIGAVPGRGELIDYL